MFLLFQNQKYVYVTKFCFFKFVFQKPPKQKNVDEMSNESLLGNAMGTMEDAMNKMKNLQKRMLINSSRKSIEEASSNIKKNFSTYDASEDTSYKNASLWSLTGTELQKKEPEHQNCKKVHCKEGLNSKLHKCILVEVDDHIYEYSYSHERNGISYWPLAVYFDFLL